MIPSVAATLKGKTLTKENLDSIKPTTTVFGFRPFDSKTVVVGVIDSGVEVDHPGLIKNMWKNVNEVPNNGKDDDGNGYIDDVYGWTFIVTGKQIGRAHV